MDAPEDRDIKAQKASGNIMSLYQSSIPQLLWMDGDSSRKVLNREVPEKELHKIRAWLEIFQEQPQLLDPYLASILSPLTTAFLEFYTKPEPPRRPSIEPVQVSEMPMLDLGTAVAQLLYTLAKVRGAKVIVRFLPNEPKWINMVLGILEGDLPDELEPIPEENAEATTEDDIEGKDLIGDASGISGFEAPPQATRLDWQLRYICLLWLSYLLLSPFDLETITITNNKYALQRPSVEVPSTLKPLTRQLVHVALRYMDSPAKERDAAAAVLVRLLVRKDTRLGLLDWFIQWSTKVVDSPVEAKASEEKFQDGTPMKVDGHVPVSSNGVFLLCGALTVLVGALSAGERTAMTPELVERIFSDTVRKLANMEASAELNTSQVRKLICKLQCSVALLLLPARSALPPSPDMEIPPIVEEIIDSLLNSLGDNDTLVRYAASKALSSLSLSLPTAEREQVLTAVVDLYDVNVFYPNRSKTGLEAAVRLQKDTSQVSASLWHGLTLTLATFLRFRSASPAMLPNIVDWIITTLSFEQRKTTFSLGGNVRDAACYAAWSLARNYSTKDLLSVKPDPPHDQSITLPQMLGRELVKVACLDQTGNIRRAASAALQEMVGRHPDVIDDGIFLIQAVDYTAVALRSRATSEVARKAAKLGGGCYLSTIVDGMLFGLRGIASQDADGRRATAKGLRGLVKVSLGLEDGVTRTGVILTDIIKRIGAGGGSDVEVRHGGWLALGESLLGIQESYSKKIENNLRIPNLNDENNRSVRLAIRGVFKGVKSRDFLTPILRPELTCEAACQLVAAQCEVSARTDNLEKANYLLPLLTPSLKRTYFALIDVSLDRTEPVVLEAAAAAARDYLSILPLEDRNMIIRFWLRKLESKHATEGVVKTLGEVFDLAADKGNDEVKGWSDVQEDIVRGLVAVAHHRKVELRVIALSSLAIVVSQRTTPVITTLLSKSLDDYSVDSRGDIGSWVRLEAVGVIIKAFKAGCLDLTLDGPDTIEHQILCKLVRLSVEKLDKVRQQVSEALFGILPKTKGGDYDAFEGASLDSPLWANTEQYFSKMLRLFKNHTFRVELMRGYVTSAGAGSESVLRASSAAMIKFIDSLEPYSDSPGEDGMASLSDVLGTLITVMEKSIEGNEARVIAPALEVLAAWFESGILSRLEGGAFRFQKLYNLTAKAHYKTGNTAKLSSAVKVYAGLASVDSVKNTTIKKLVSMLVHPFPKVRAEVADVLYLTLSGDGTCEDAEMLIIDTNWTSPTKELKEVVEGIKKTLGEAGIPF